MAIIYFGTFLRILLVFYSSYIALLPGADHQDAVRFHNMALDILENNNLFVMHEIPFINLLAFLYKYISQSFFFGSFLSVIAIFFSALFLKKSMEIIKTNKNLKNLILFFFLFLSSCIIITS